MTVQTTPDPLLAALLPWRPRNARFWVYARDGWVKLSLREGERLDWGWTEPHEEGYSEEWYSWELRGGVVYRESRQGGRDCDGHTYTDREDCCPVGRLASHPASPEGHWPDLPTWEEERAEVFDEYARAAGY